MTPTQARYLAFIHSYTRKHGIAPAESEIANAMCVMPPSVNQMVKSLERAGLISRVPGTARSIRILLPEDQIPKWGRSGKIEVSESVKSTRRSKAMPPLPSVDLYVIDAWLHAGPIAEKDLHKRSHRVIEIRADQTLANLHTALCKAFERPVEKDYEFNIGGKKRFDPVAKNYGPPSSGAKRNKAFGRTLPAYSADSRTVTLQEVELSVHQVFGYCLDFDLDWYFFISVERIEKAIATVTYPRVIRRIGKFPAQDPSV